MPITLDVLFFAKLAMCAGFLVIYVLLERRCAEIRDIPLNRLALLYLAVRAGLFVAVFLVLRREPSGDIVNFYIPYAERVIAGGVPNRDFSCAYGTFFPYIIAGLLRIHHGQMPIILFSGLTGLATFLLFAHILRLLLRADAQGLRADNATRVLLLFALSPLDMWITAVTGLNQTWLGLTYTICLMLLLTSRPFLAGLASGLSLHLLKLLTALHFPSLLAVAKHKARFILGYALGLAGMGVALTALDVNVLGPLNQLDMVSTGNLHYLASLFLSDLTWVRASMQAVLFGATAWFTIRHGLLGGHGPDKGAALMTLLAFTFYLTSVKAYPSYLLCFLPPILLFVALQADARRLSRIFFCLNILFLLESHVGFQTAKIGKPGFHFLDYLATVSPPDALVVVVIDLAMVAACVYFWLRAWKALEAHRVR